MSYLEELLPEFRKGAKITRKYWGEDCFVYYKEGIIYDQDNKIMPRLAFSSIVSDDWALYQEPINWDYIIKNKCLCWFWDDDESEKTVSILINAEKDEYTPFLLYDECYFEHCRPVRRDEVTFYEDKRDEI